MAGSGVIGGAAGRGVNRTASRHSAYTAVGEA